MPNVRCAEYIHLDNTTALPTLRDIVNSLPTMKYLKVVVLIHKGIFPIMLGMIGARNSGILWPSEAKTRSPLKVAWEWVAPAQKDKHLT
jgi:hypothetical protein